jgi:hypothetical protein
MDTVHCPFFDVLVRKLVDAYRRMDDHDIFGMLAGSNRPNDIDDIRLQMAEHREACFLCQSIDRKSKLRKSLFRVPSHRVQAIR